MRYIPHIMIFVGICLLGHAAYDEHRGVVVSRFRLVQRTEDPQRFRSLMLSEWLRASIFVCAGFVILGIYRRADRLDPFSPDFTSNSALDELDQTLTDEQRKQRKPIR